MNLFVILNELKSTGKKPWADPGSNSGLMTFKVHSYFCRTFYMNYSFDIRNQEVNNISYLLAVSIFLSYLCCHYEF